MSTFSGTFLEPTRDNFEQHHVNFLSTVPGILSLFSKKSILNARKASPHLEDLPEILLNISGC